MAAIIAYKRRDIPAIGLSSSQRSILRQTPLIERCLTARRRNDAALCNLLVVEIIDDNIDHVACSLRSRRPLKQGCRGVDSGSHRALQLERVVRQRVAMRLSWPFIL